MNKSRNHSHLHLPDFKHRRVAIQKLALPASFYFIFSTLSCNFIMVNELVRQLPPELWVQIFKQLPINIVKQLVPICKYWKAPSLEVYYEEKALGSVKIFDLAEMFSKDEEQKLLIGGEYVKCLKIYQDFQYLLPSGHLVKLLRNLPNLKVLDLSKSGNHCGYYLKKIKNFLGFQKNKDLLEQLEAIITTLDLRRGDGFDPHYLNICALRPSKLTHFQLNAYYDAAKYGMSYLDYLRKLESLQHLYISSTQFDPLFNIITVLQTCPNLESFRLNSRKLQFDQNDNESIGAIDRYSHLKSIEYFFPDISIKKLLPFLPATLGFLGLEISLQVFDVWWNNSQSELFQFSTYFNNHFCRIPQLRLDFSCRDVEDDTKKLLLLQLSNIPLEQRINQLSSFINHISSINNHFLCSFTLDLVDNNADLMDTDDHNYLPQFELNRANGFMHVSYGIRFRNAANNIILPSFLTAAQHHQMPFVSNMYYLYVNLIPNIGAGGHALDINTAFHCILNNLVNCCPRLSAAIIMLSPDGGCALQSDLYDKNLVSSSEAEYQDYLSQASTQNMSYCSLTNIRVSEHLINIISGQFINVNTFRLEKCTFDTDPSTNNLYMDFRNVLDVQDFYLDAKKNEEAISYILVEYDMGSQWYQRQADDSFTQADINVDTPEYLYDLEYTTLHLIFSNLDIQNFVVV
jgi:hypothetical protein